MNVTDETPTDETASPLERASPGKLLKQARESRRLSAEDVARDLRLAPARVEALEADDYRNMPAPTFVRGYLRSYARLVRLSEEEVLAAYDEAQKPRVAPIAEAPKPAPSVPRQARSGDRPVRVVTYLLVALLVVLVFSWWKGRWEIPVAPRPGSATTAELDKSSAPAVTSGSSAPAAEPAVPAEAPPGQTTVVTAPATGASAPAQAAPKPSASSTASAESPKKAATAETPKAVVETPRPEAAAPAGKTPSAPAPVAENTVQVSLIFDGESWADVRDARRQRLVYQQFKPGQSVTVSGVPPFKVYLSNAGAVRMRYAGEPYDVAAHRTGLYARFSVGTAVQ